jgi:DNA-directed RNA polymerase specialized sigma24 family protein
MDTTTDQLLQHADFVRRLCRGLLSDADAADDLAQDTLTAALEERSLRSPRAWLASVARRLAARRLRTDSRRARVETFQTDQEGLEIRLPRGLALDGVLLDAERRPLAEHWVVAVGADRMLRRGKTDEKGVFTLRGLPDGECDVSVTDKNGQVILETTLAAGTGGAELRVPAR